MTTPVPHAPAPQSPSPPGGLDFVEYLLKRVLIGAVILLVLLLAAIWALRTWGPASPVPNTNPGATAAAPGSTAATPAARTVALVIDHGDGIRVCYDALVLPADATVADALKAAARVPARPLDIAITGEGPLAFVASIDRVANQGGGDASKNWQFWVNDEFAKAGAGDTPVRPGDVVTWVFRPWETNPVAPPSARPRAN